MDGTSSAERAVARRVGERLLRIFETHDSRPEITDICAAARAAVSQGAALDALGGLLAVPVPTYLADLTLETGVPECLVHVAANLPAALADVLFAAPEWDTRQYEICFVLVWTGCEDAFIRSLYWYPGGTSHLKTLDDIIGRLDFASVSDDVGPDVAGIAWSLYNDGLPFTDALEAAKLIDGLR